MLRLCSALKSSARSSSAVLRFQMVHKYVTNIRLSSTFSANIKALRTQDDEHVPGLLLHRQDTTTGRQYKHFYPSTWLRDHCRCPQCFYQQTQQRQADTLKACEHARIVAAEVIQCGMIKPAAGGSHAPMPAGGDSEVIKITWEGGHESLFEPSWLHRYSMHIKPDGPSLAPTPPRGTRQASAGSGNLSGGGLKWKTRAHHVSAQRRFTAPPYADDLEDPANDSSFAQLWSAVESFGQTSPTSTPTGGMHSLPTVSANAYMQTAQGLLDALELLRCYGFVLVEGLEVSMEATEAAARRIAAPMRTLYSETGMWRTEIRPDPAAINDTAFTTLPLAAHTDGNYCLETPGLQCFHALKADPTGGGRTQLIDAFAVAQHLHSTLPTQFDRLTQLKIPYHHTDPQSIVWAYKPILKVSDSGDALAAVHWNADDRAPYTGSPGASKEALGEDGMTLSDAAQQVVDLYGAVQAWKRAVNEPKWSLWLDLKPGTLLVFNNHRVLHGRSAVHPASGRVLAGCYHSTEDWKSKLRVLRSQGLKPA